MKAKNLVVIERVELKKMQYEAMNRSNQLVKEWDKKFGDEKNQNRHDPEKIKANLDEYLKCQREYSELNTRVDLISDLLKEEEIDLSQYSNIDFVEIG